MIWIDGEEATGRELHLLTALFDAITGNPLMDYPRSDRTRILKAGTIFQATVEIGEGFPIDVKITLHTAQTPPKYIKDIKRLILNDLFERSVCKNG